jgi:hypothetical protein
MSVSSEAWMTGTSPVMTTVRIARGLRPPAFLRHDLKRAAAEIVENLEGALDRFRKVAAGLQTG